MKRCVLILRERAPECRPSFPLARREYYLTLKQTVSSAQTSELVFTLALTLEVDMRICLHKTRPASFLSYMDNVRHNRQPDKTKIFKKA